MAFFNALGLYVPPVQWVAMICARAKSRKWILRFTGCSVSNRRTMFLSTTYAVLWSFYANGPAPNSRRPYPCLPFAVSRAHVRQQFSGVNH